MGQINEWAEVIKQFIWTGLMAAVVLAALLLWEHISYQDNRNWLRGGVVVVLAALAFLPNGWNTVFAPSLDAWDAMIQARDHASPGSLFQADLAGVVIGSLVAFIGFIGLKSKNF